MITPILQRAPGANLGDPVREPEINWSDFGGGSWPAIVADLASAGSATGI